MKLEAVDLPDELVRAQREGRLVLFVGAGASVAAPSSLPTFEGLAKRIGEESGKPYPGASATSPDRFLGELKTLGVDVHVRVHKIVDCPDSRPNSLHRAIAALASTSNSPRIVTTNYDRHLSSCAPELTEFAPPALPTNDDFAGIVYLHGSVSQCPENLIVTNADFGKAYLNDGSVTAVLRKVFRNHVVLFIGYSHRDTLMEYLAAGLPSGTQRYTLCEDPDDRRWDELGIQSIGYPCHEVLPQAIDQWTERAGMSLLDHAESVRQLVEGVPVLSSVDESYLEEVITDPQMISFFTDHARGRAWLEWIANRDAFGSIFEPLETVGEVGTALGWWFCRHFVVNPALSDTALRVIGKRRSGLGPALAARVTYTIREAVRQGGFGALHRWMSLAVTGDLAPGARQAMWRLLMDCDPARDRETLLLIFDRLAEPVPILDQAMLVPLVSPAVDVVIKESYWFDKVWQGRIKPHLDILANDLMIIIDRHLRLAHRFALVVDESTINWDALSSAKTTVKPQELYHRDTIDPLIDAACDTLEAMLHNSPESADYFLSSWSTAPQPLLRRLAVHGWARRRDREPDQKLDWLIETGDFVDPQYQAEVRDFLELVLPHTGDTSTESLVRRLLSFLTNADSHVEYGIYILLSDISKHKPCLVRVQEALAELQADHPNWSPGDVSYSMPPIAVTPLPLAISKTPEELHKLCLTSLPTAIDWLTGYIVSSSISEQFAAHKILEETVKRYSVDGVRLLGHLVTFNNNNQDISQQVATTILNALNSTLENVPHEELIELLPRIWGTGSAMWLDEGDPQVGDKAWLHKAINHWAGCLTQLALGIAASLPKDTDESGNLPPTLRNLLERMIVGTDCASAYAQVVISSQLFFLFTRDRQWCISMVLPLLDPTVDEDRALRCWDGQLTWGKFNSELLEAGLLGHYVTIITLFDKLGSKSSEALHHHLASLALLHEINPLENGWLGKFTVDAGVEHRVEWIRTLTFLLRKRPIEEAERHWNTWMRRYWENRLESIPRGLTPSEASALAEWSLTLGDSFREAANLAGRYEARLGERSMVLIWLDRSLDLEEPFPRPDYASEYPEEVARLLLHLMSNTPESYSALDLYLGPVVRQLRDKLGRQHMAPIVSQGLRLRALASES